MKQIRVHEGLGVGKNGELFGSDLQFLSGMMKYFWKYIVVMIAEYLRI